MRRSIAAGDISTSIERLADSSGGLSGLNGGVIGFESQGFDIDQILGPTGEPFHLRQSYGGYYGYGHALPGIGYSSRPYIFQTRKHLNEIEHHMIFPLKLVDPADHTSRVVARAQRQCLHYFL